MFGRMYLQALRTSDLLANAVLRRVGTALPGVARAHDALVIKQRMRQALGYEPDLRDPRTYNEKLAWRILYDKNPLIPLTTDKVGVRDYVAARLSPDLLIPLVGVYENVGDIVWEDLPEQFIIKATHGCEMNVIVRDRDTADRDHVLRTAAGWLKQNYYETSREWAYRGIPPRLIIERLLVDAAGNIPVDFKFLIFHGKTALVRTHLDRFGDHRVNFYDADLNLVPLRQVYPTDPSYQPPVQVRSMMRQAERLAEDFDYARIDMYLVDGRAWFGEITHHDGNACIFFEPQEFDRTLGDLWQLPAATRGRRR